MYSFSLSATSLPRKMISTAPFAPMTATSPEGHLANTKGAMHVGGILEINYCSMRSFLQGCSIWTLAGKDNGVHLRC